MKPEIIEVFADNGEHSHWRLVDETGKTIWNESHPSAPNEKEIMNMGVVFSQNENFKHSGENYRSGLGFGYCCGYQDGLKAAKHEDWISEGVKLIAAERKRYGNEIHYDGSDIAEDFLTLQKGLRHAIDTKDPRLQELLIKSGALIAAEIDRLQSQPPSIK
jgi:hypothetical protein